MGKGLKFNEPKFKLAEVINVLTEIVCTAVKNSNYLCKTLSVCIAVYCQENSVSSPWNEFFRTLK